LITNLFAKITEDKIVCPICKINDAKRLFSPTKYVICDIEPYWDENLSDQYGRAKLIKSRQHKKQVLKEMGLVEAG
jgi:hypothetical protein